MPLISTEPHCTVVLFAPDRGGLCAVPILKIRERDTGKQVCRLGEGCKTISRLGHSDFVPVVDSLNYSIKINA